MAQQLFEGAAELLQCGGPGRPRILQRTPGKKQAFGQVRQPVHVPGRRHGGHFHVPEPPGGGGGVKEERQRNTETGDENENDSVQFAPDLHACTSRRTDIAESTISDNLKYVK